MRMLDQTAAFPKKINIDQYMPLIDAALAATLGADKLPKAVLEDYATVELATKAAKTIRYYVQQRKIDLCVVRPKESKTVAVYKGKTQRRQRRSENEPNATTNQPAPSESPQA